MEYYGKIPQGLRYRNDQIEIVNKPLQKLLQTLSQEFHFASIYQVLWVLNPGIYLNEFSFKMNG